MLEYNSWSTRLKALRCKLFGKTDFGRWTDASEFEDWEERTKIIARVSATWGEGDRVWRGNGQASTSSRPKLPIHPVPSAAPWGVRTSAAVREDCRAGRRGDCLDGLDPDPVEGLQLGGARALSEPRPVERLDAERVARPR